MILIFIIRLKKYEQSLQTRNKMGYKYCLFYIVNENRKILGYFNSQEEMQQKLNTLPPTHQYLCEKYVRILIPPGNYHSRIAV